MRDLVAASVRLFPGSAQVAGAVLLLALTLPATSAGQVLSRGDTDSGGNGGGGRAVPRNEAPAPAPAPARAPAAPRASEPRPAPSRTPAAETSGAQSTPRAGARPREGRPTVGAAVPRGSVSRPPQIDRPVVVPVYYGSYWPWGFGGLGYGSYYGSYYGGFYDPWYGGIGYPSGYGYPQSAYTYRGDGQLRLKIRPREAQVFVDGYYAGVVDDFDGVFQRLHLEPGPHRIEVRAPGYETLTFDVQIRFDRTTTFEGELGRNP